MMYGLTEKQAKVFEFIQTFIARNGYSPSLQEIAEHHGSKHKSPAHAILEGLRRRGLIKWQRGRARSIYLTDGLGLPPDVDRALSDYCARTGDNRIDVIADAIRLHLDDLEDYEEAA